MKKKILATFLAIGILSSNCIAFAHEEVLNNPETSSTTSTEYTSPELLDDFDYTASDFDWSQIEQIHVFFLASNTTDDFIKTAIENGVDVSFSPTVFSNIQPRYTFFSSMSWITRSGVVSLSLNPVHPYSIDKENAWAEAVRYFQYHPIYRDISNPSKFMSLYNQFVCHADFAKGFKTPWNIEPATKDKGYWGFVSSKCN